MKITVRIKGRYGHKDIIPVDDNAKDIQKALNGTDRENFTPKQIEFLEVMGVEVDVETPTI